MLQQRPAASSRSAHVLTVSLARDENEVYDAQRLRYKVFAEKMGARLSSREPGIDADIFDPFFDHLIVGNRNFKRHFWPAANISPSGPASHPYQRRISAGFRA